MMPQPTGRLVRKDDGVYVVLNRIFAAPIEDVWSYFSRSPRLALWIGEFTGVPSTGAVRFRMNDEEGADWVEVSILECEAPHRFWADVGPAGESWRVFWHLKEAMGHTTLTFGQRLHSLKAQADVGVGWDYYLDRMMAARAGTPMPLWDDYYPAMMEHYESLGRELERDLRSEQVALHVVSDAGDPGSSYEDRAAQTEDRLRESAE